jgi:hypothetical protein
MDVFVLFSVAMQVNKTLTSLDLRGNNLGPEGGRALVESLEVRVHVSWHKPVPLLSTSNDSALW